MELGAAATAATAALAVAAGPTVSARPAAAWIKLIIDVAEVYLSTDQMLVTVGTMAAAEVPAAGVAVGAGWRAGDSGYNRPSCGSRPGWTGRQYRPKRQGRNP